MIFNFRLERALIRWLQKTKRAEISDAMMKGCALYYATKFGNENFQASSGWLRNFKRRNNIPNHVETFNLSIDCDADYAYESDDENDAANIERLMQDTNEVSIRSVSQKFMKIINQMEIIKRIQPKVDLGSEKKKSEKLAGTVRNPEKRKFFGVREPRFVCHLSYK